MANEPFQAPLAKIARSREQINDLDRAIKLFIESSGYEICSELDFDKEEEIWRFKLKEKIPNKIAVQCGEIIHNLRSALDQTLAEIVSKSANRSESGVEFPFGKDIFAFEVALAKQKKLPSKAKELIKNLRPYSNGNDLLWFLHDINKHDKHRSDLVPVNLRTGGKTSYLSVWFGQALVIGSKSGQHLSCERTISDADYVRLALSGKAWGIYGLTQMDPYTGLPLAPTPSAISFENLGGSAENTWEFLTTTPGTKFKTDFEPSFDLAFRGSGALERKPVAIVLSDACEMIESIIQRFQDEFFPDHPK